MSIINKDMPIENLAALITKHLESKGIDAVMVGGSVVSIYTNNEYKSRDIDFISPNDHRDIKKAMAEIGFVAKGKDFYHEDTNFTVEFPSGPIGIGAEVPVKPEGVIDVDGTKVKLLSPTQSVMDRLASFYFFNDRQCLDQAVMICKSQNVSLSKVKNWSEKEGELKKYLTFEALIKSNGEFNS